MPKKSLANNLIWSANFIGVMLSISPVLSMKGRKKLCGRDQRQAQREIGDELQNVQAAWRWVVKNRNRPLIRILVEGLYLYYESKSWFEEGVQVFEQAIEKVREMTLADAQAAFLLADLLGKQAVFYRQLSQYVLASSRIEEGLKLLHDQVESAEKAFLTLQMAWICFLQARYLEAQAWAQESLQLSQALDNLRGIGDSLYLLGWTAYERGQFNEAETLCSRAKTICEEIDYEWGSQYALYGLGLVKHAQGHTDAAQRFFLQNCHFCEEREYRWGAALAQINLGLVELSRGDKHTAHQFFQCSLHTCQEIGNPWGIAQSYKGLGYVALEERDYEAARSYAEQSLHLYRQMEDQDGIADCLLILCQVAYANDQVALAWEYLTTAEEMVARSQNRFREARTFYQRAKIYLQEGDQQQAAEWLQKTLHHPACEWAIAQKARIDLQRVSD